LFVSSTNSALSNLRNGNITDFRMSYKSAKDPIQTLHYEDSNFPAFFKKLKSRYTYTKRRGLDGKRRNTMSFSEIFKSTKKRGFNFTHDTILNRYYLCYSVDATWYPNDD
jgi:hypothetical protein